METLEQSSLHGAHSNENQRFIVGADEKLTAFVERDSTIL